MSVGWFIAPFARRLASTRPERYCVMDDFTTIILADDGDWHETEVLGNRAVVKVRASAATLTLIAAAPGIKRLPKDALGEPLSDLTNTQKTALQGELLDMGYSLSELRAALGNDLGSKTLGDVVRFAARRRLKPRYDSATDTIILDGPVQPCRSIDDVDLSVI